MPRELNYFTPTLTLPLYSTKITAVFSNHEPSTMSSLPRTSSPEDIVINCSFRKSWLQWRSQPVKLDSLGVWFCLPMRQRLRISHITKIIDAILVPNSKGVRELCTTPVPEDAPSRQSCLTFHPIPLLAISRGIKINSLEQAEHLRREHIPKAM